MMSLQGVGKFAVLSLVVALSSLPARAQEVPSLVGTWIGDRDTLDAWYFHLNPSSKVVACYAWKRVR